MDPMPIKHPAVLLARVRDSLTPVLSEAGFGFGCRNHPIDPGREHLWIDFYRGQDTISLRWNRWYATLTLEFMTADSEVRVLAEGAIAGSRTHQQLIERLDRFLDSAKEAIDSLDCTSAKSE